MTRPVISESPRGLQGASINCQTFRAGAALIKPNPTRSRPTTSLPKTVQLSSSSPAAGASEAGSSPASSPSSASSSAGAGSADSTSFIAPTKKAVKIPPLNRVPRKNSHVGGRPGSPRVRAWIQTAQTWIQSYKARDNGRLRRGWRGARGRCQRRAAQRAGATAAAPTAAALRPRPRARRAPR